MAPSPPIPTDPFPQEPGAPIGREPLHQAIATARDERRGGISLGTLAVAAVASAVASFTVSHLWKAGTVVSAAVTPVLVALAKEFLQRPVDHVAATAQRVAPGRPRRGPQSPPARAQEPSRPAPPADWAPVSYGERPRAGWHPRWRLVLLTGLLAFIIVVGVITIPELLVGHSITGVGGPTTFVSGSGSSAPAPKTPTTTQTTPPAVSPSATTTATTPATTNTAPQATTPTTDTTSTAPAPPGGTATTVPTTPSAAPGAPPSR